jgi:hypothetical protein
MEVSIMILAVMDVSVGLPRMIFGNWAITEFVHDTITQKTKRRYLIIVFTHD